MKNSLCLLFTLGGLLTGCAEPRPIVSQGHTRFLSDRAWEIDATVRGSAPASGAWLDLVRQADALAARGKPLFLSQARVTFAPAPGAGLAYEARVESFARLERGGLYGDEPGVSFRWPPPEAALAAPRYEALARGGMLRVGAVFGQMRPDDASPTADDEGWWSWRTLREALQQHGYEPRPDPLGAVATIWRRSVGDLVVEVELRGPDEFSLASDGAGGAGRMRALLGRSAVVYVNGHAQRAAFAPIDELASYLPARSRLLVLDLCWSYFDHARRVLDAAGDAQVITTDGRVVTGSVVSFSELLTGLVDGVARPSTGARWLTLLGAMNEAAAARAVDRSGQVTGVMEPPEVYGVSPAW